MLRVIQETIIVLVGLALCLEHVNLSLGFFILTPSKAVNALLLGVVALEWAAGKRSAYRDRKSLWLAFLFVAVGVSTIQAVIVGTPLAATLTVTQKYVALFLFYFALSFVLTTQRRLMLLIVSIILSACFVTVTAAAGIGVQAGGRMGGWGGNVNLLAQNLLVALCAAYALYVTAKSPGRRVGLLVICILMLLGLINTFSRAGFLAIPLMLLLWMFRFGRLDLLRFAIPIVVVLAVGFFVLPEAVLERLYTLSPDEIEKDGSAMSRVLQLRVAFEAVLSNPLSGVGLANFLFWAKARTGLDVGVVHNGYMGVFAEMGLLGFVPMIALMTLTWRDFSRSFTVARRLRRLRDPQLRWIEMQARMLQIGFLSVLVMSMFHPTTTKKTLWLMFALSTVLWRMTRARYQALQPQEAEAEPPVTWEPLRPAVGAASPALRSPPS